MGSLIGIDPAQKLVTQIAGMALNYFKKDDIAKTIFAPFGRKNSIAAEVAGRSANVWEWDAVTIDRFIVNLEKNGILTKEPYARNQLPKYEPVFMKVPFKKDPVKLPFKRRKRDYEFSSKQLRQGYGGAWKDIGWDFINQYAPWMLLAILSIYLQKAFDEWFEKKK